MQNAVITAQAQRDIEFLMNPSKVIKSQFVGDFAASMEKLQDAKLSNDSTFKKYRRWKKSFYNV